MTVTMETKRIQIPKQELTAELKVLAVKRVKAVQSAAPPGLDREAARRLLGISRSTAWRRLRP